MTAGWIPVDSVRDARRVIELDIEIVQPAAVRFYMVVPDRDNGEERNEEGEQDQETDCDGGTADPLEDDSPHAHAGGTMDQPDS